MLGRPPVAAEAVAAEATAEATTTEAEASSFSTASGYPAVAAVAEATIPVWAAMTARAEVPVAVVPASGSASGSPARMVFPCHKPSEGKSEV